MHRMDLRRSVSRVALWVMPWVAFLLASLASLAQQTPFPTPDILSPQERQWLAEHRDTLVLGCFERLPPIEFFDEAGRASGITGDYIEVLERILECEFKVVAYDDWGLLLKDAKSRRVDIVAAIQQTPKRSEYLIFTRPYVEIPNVLVTRTGGRRRLGLDDLQDMKVGVVEDFAVHSYLQASFGYLDLVPVSNDAEGLREASFGEIDVMVVNLATASHVTQQLGLTNLRVAGTAELPYSLAIGCRSDWPVLCRILDKGLDAVPPEKRSAIRGKWMPLTMPETFDWSPVLAVITVLLLFAIGVLAWNRSLRRKVLARTEQVRLDEARLEALLELNQMTDASIKDLTDFALEEGVKLTKSRIGYLAFLNDDETVLTMHSWSRGAMAECAIIDKPIEYPVETTGLWGETVRQRKPVTTNDYNAPNPLKKGYPSGHVDVRRHMNIPLFDGDRIVAVAGVGNKEQDYDASDVRQLTLLMGGMWRFLQRRQAAESLARLQGLLDSIVNSMPSVIVGVDREGRVTQWNAEAERLAGLGAEDSQGKPVGSVLPLFEHRLAKVQEAIAARRVFEERKVPWERGDGRCFFDITVYPLREVSLEGAVIRIDDVTERVRLEERMVQSAKMASVGGLAAGMAHEINNPLAAILQNAQVMARRTMADTDGNRGAAKECGVGLAVIQEYLARREVPRMLESLQSSGKQAAGIVENMISFSRLDSGQFRAHCLDELLDATVALAKSDYDLGRKYDFREFHLCREYEADMPEVPCERGQIQQVVLNVLRNCAQALGEESAAAAGSEAAGKEPRLTLRLRTDGDAARIEIEDNGPGMDDDTRCRIFEPFFTTKDVGAGTGLGLSVSYFIITENHGGEMAVESSPGKGARFIIRLPLRRDG